MYVRRKVFSLLEDEMGEMRYFSTNEFVYDGYEDRYFSDEEEDARDSGIAKGALIGAGIATGAGAGIAGAGIGAGKLASKVINKVGDSKSLVKNLNKANFLKAGNEKTELMERLRKDLRKSERAEYVENLTGKAKNAVVNAWKSGKAGKAKVIGGAAAVTAAGAGIGAGVKAIKNRKNKSNEE